MLTELFVGALGQMLGELLGEALEQPAESFFGDRALRHEIAAAVTRAEGRFAAEYRAQDAELADALATQTHFADLPSVQAALRELLTQPFRSPQPHILLLRRSFADVLPTRIDRERVDAAVSAFLHILGQEVLMVAQLRELYALAFQKTSAESGRLIAGHTAALVEGISGLRSDIKQLAPPPSVPLLTAGQREERPRPWHNLPQRSYTRFVGRQEELAKLAQLLLPYPRSRHFLITLDGIGGVGKSALAIELAYGYRDGYSKMAEAERFAAIVWVSAKRTLLTANGVYQRPQGFSTLEDLFREIATVLDDPAILQADIQGRRALVERTLSRQRTLLIVDNLETVDDEELLAFLREIPDPTKVIVTTRHRIDVAYALRLSGMPERDALALIEQEAATRGVTLPPGSAEELFRRTGGLPLAIVWSIGLMSLGHSVESVVRRLGQGHSDIARFCFAESVARIKGRDGERLLLALALFDAHVSRQMLGAVAGLGDDPIGRDDGLAQLLQLSLVNQKGDRFFLLPLTQSFALDELGRQPALERELRERWVGHLTELARPYAVLHSIRRDLMKLRREGTHLIAMSHWAQQVNRLDLLIDMLPALIYYYDLTGQWTEMIRISQIGLEYSRLMANYLSVITIETYAFAWVFSQQGRHREAEQMINDALQIARQIGDRSWECEALYRLAAVLRRSGSFEQATACCEQALELATLLDDEQRTYMQANIHHELGKIARDLEDWEQARQYFLTAQEVFRPDDDNPLFNFERSWGVRSNLAFIDYQTGKLDRAAKEYQQCLTFFRDIGGKSHMTTLLVRLAALEEQRGNREAALAHAQEALEWSERLGMVRERAEAQGVVERCG